VLPKYDWLHLHHEDFTGQYGKFYSQFSNMPWYIEQQKDGGMELKGARLMEPDTNCARQASMTHCGIS